VKIKLRLLAALFFYTLLSYSQIDIALYEQFNGRYNFTMVGNTLNLQNNVAANDPCTILTTSSAALNLAASDQIEAAYLYWAGSGPGDFNIKVNGQAVAAGITFPVVITNIDENPRAYFSAFADITPLVLATGNGNYTISDLDLTDVVNMDTDPFLNTYCQYATNFGGWAIVVIYKNDAFLPLQLNVYHGLQAIPSQVNITLDNLNVVSNVGSSIGFIAWEGDQNIAVGESLKINGITMSNTLNPPTNAFNGTNSFTGSDQLYNMDLDLYTLDNVINIGDDTAEIQLQSGQDFVMMNTVVTRINSIAPDATVSFTTNQQCDSRTMTVNYSVKNLNSTAPLPANTPVSVYLNGDLYTIFNTTAAIPVGGSQNGTLTITVPAGAPLNFQLLFIADDNGTGVGTVEETNENNNSFTYNGTIWVSPSLANPADVTACAVTDDTGTFNFSAYAQSLKQNPTDVVTFYTTPAAAQQGNGGNITNITGYDALSNAQTIYVRLTDEHGCFVTAQFQLVTVLCADATVVINSFSQTCDSREITVNYTVNNIGDIPLPAGTPVAVYANTTLLTVLPTSAEIAVGASLTATTTVTIPASIPLSFDLIFMVDDNGTGTGIVPEKYEDNNTSIQPIMLWVSPILVQPADIEGCETFNGSGIGQFDFTAYFQSLKINDSDTVAFYANEADAIEGNSNTIPDAANYQVPDGTEVFVRLTDEHGCFDIGSFTLVIIDCYFPDATVVIEEVFKQCNSRIIHVHYTVSNLIGTDVLPANTPISIYVNGVLLEITQTQNELAIGASEESYITLTIPIGVPLDFDLIFVADDIGDGTGAVIELDETNNANTLPTELVLSPVIVQPEDIIACDAGLGLGTFDFSAYAQSIKNFDNEVVTFYGSQPTADQALDPIYNTTAYHTTQNPQRIYVRLDNGTCHTTASFLLQTKKCAPIVYNYVTPNGDGLNDGFFVEGLRNVFLNFKMSIYNRYGNLVWTGDHSQADWNGIADVSKVGSENTTVPNGTYYFVLELNDADYPEPIVGWVYVTM
jgi:gliding motility-associated-like protein